MLKILKSLPVQLVLSILLAVISANFLDLYQTRFVFTLSCLLKEILVAVLPFVILSYIGSALLAMQQRGPILIFSLLGLVFLSNFIASLMAYWAGHLILPFITQAGATAEMALPDDITQLFSLNLPKILAPNYAMMIGVSIGMIFNIIKVPVVLIAVNKLKKYVTLFLQKIFIPLLPLYVFGFVIKMQKEGTLKGLVENYAQVFVLLCVLFTVYVALFYFVSSGFKLRETIGNMKNMLPAGITGFSTMSSAATMPLTLASTIKNTKDAEFTQLVVPSTASIHSIGDCLGIPIMAMAIMILSGMPLPTFSQYLIFTFYFVLARFSTGGIPGGGVIVSLPATAMYLGMNSEMNSLLTTIYILQDPLITITNVMGVGSFGVLTHKLAKKFKLISESVSPKTDMHASLAISNDNYQPFIEEEISISPSENPALSIKKATYDS